MDLFVTGGAGFIGRNLVSRLSQLGHRVSCLVREAGQARWMEDCPGLTPVAGDLLVPGSYRAALGKSELVFHLAGLTKARTRAEYLETNGEGTGRLAEAAAAPGSRVRKIVYVSSLAVAGPHCAARPAREEEEARPITHYGESKLLGEELLRRHCGAAAWAVVRPAVVYGPFDRDVYAYFRAAARGFVPLVGGGTLELSLLHVADLVEALTLAAFSERSDGRVYFVSDGESHTSGEVVAILRDLAGRARVVPIPAAALRLAGLVGDLAAAVTRKGVLLNSQKAREALQEGWVCSNERIREELGFAPRVDLESGFRATFGWYRENGWI
ncbi:MAG: NAD-dependent epimerase/dehydratase family protein [Deferrisomatales bacterium]